MNTTTTTTLRELLRTAYREGFVLKRDKPRSVRQSEQYAWGASSNGVTVHVFDYGDLLSERWQVIIYRYYGGSSNQVRIHHDVTPQRIAAAVEMIKE